MSRTDIQTRVRLPQDVKAWMDRDAEANCRSLNAQIVYCLKSHIKKAPGESLATNPDASQQPLKDELQ